MVEKLYEIGLYQLIDLEDQTYNNTNVAVILNKQYFIEIIIETMNSGSEYINKTK